MFLLLLVFIIYSSSYLQMNDLQQQPQSTPLVSGTHTHTHGIVGEQTKDMLFP